MSGLRSREEDTRYQTYVHMHSNAYGWDLSSPASFAGRRSGIEEMCTDNWRKLIKSNNIIIGSMQRSAIERTASDDAINEYSPYFVGGPVNTYTGDFAGLIRNSTSQFSLNHDPSLRAAAEANAIIKAMAKANGSETFAGETLATLGETVSMLKKPLTTAWKLTRKVKAGRHRLQIKHPGRTIAQNTAAAWLEARYGWKPLMMDLELIMNSIVSVHEQLKRRLVVRGSEKVPINISEDEYLVNLPGDYARWTANGAVTRTEEVRASAGIIIDIVPMSTLDMVMKVFGFRCKDLPTTLWALTPLSFVWDWFVNFEAWLTAIIPDPTVTVRGSWVTSVAEVKLDYSSASITAQPSGSHVTSVDGTCAPTSIKTLDVRRTPNPPIPSLPVLTTETLSLRHRIDSVALLTGAVISNLKDLRH